MPGCSLENGTWVYTTTGEFAIVNATGERCGLAGEAFGSQLLQRYESGMV